MKRYAPFVAAFATLAVVAVACDDAIIRDAFCTDIPTGGCPEAVGDACEDPSCAAVYRCSRSTNTWTLSHDCPAHDGGVEADAAADAGADGARPLPLDADVDAPPGAFGGPGCPNLEEPDCPLGVALSCAAGCCGCEDLFVCVNGGWNVWGTCQDGVVGQVRSSAPEQR
jgi:hypothetical protein